MNQRHNKIIELIRNGIESETVDFKQQYYHEAKKSDFIKDIISFANALSREDKYIVFGISDETREIVGIAENQIPDISDLNQIIRVYCEPFIEIDVEKFDIDGKNIGAIIVKNTNMQKPYVVAKDYSFRDKTHLHAGDIYIRKSANNFRALRNDIEEIYETRLVVNMSSVNKKIYIGAVNVARVDDMFVRIPISFVNNTENTFVFNKADIKWIYSDSKTGSSVLYVEEGKTQFKQKLSQIETSPYMLPSKSQDQKVLYAKVSEGFSRVIKNHENMQQELIVEIELYDVCGNKFKTSFVVDTILWE